MTACGTRPVCSFDGCEDAARRGGLCWGHLDQRRRGAPLTEKRERGQGPKAVLMEAIFALADAELEGEGAWGPAWNRLRIAARRYVLSEEVAGARRRWSGGGQHPLPLPMLRHLTSIAARAAFQEAIREMWDVDALDTAAWEAAWERVRVAARRYVLADKGHSRRRV